MDRTTPERRAILNIRSREFGLQYADAVQNDFILAYDVDEEGRVVFTNGNAVFQLGPEGVRQQLVTESMIEQVFFIPQADAAEN